MKSGQYPITPALWQIVRFKNQVLHKESITVKDDFIRLILRSEGELYELVFDTFAYANRLSLDIHPEYGYQVFLLTCQYKFSEHQEFSHLLKNNQIIFRKIFDIYWLLAEDETYWPADQVAMLDHYLEHAKIIEIWQDKYRYRIGRYQPEIDKILLSEQD